MSTQPKSSAERVREYRQRAKQSGQQTISLLLNNDLTERIKNGAEIDGLSQSEYVSKQLNLSKTVLSIYEDEIEELKQKLENAANPKLADDYESLEQTYKYACNQLKERNEYIDELLLRVKTEAVTSNDKVYQQTSALTEADLKEQANYIERLITENALLSANLKISNAELIRLRIENNDLTIRLSDVEDAEQAKHLENPVTCNDTKLKPLGQCCAKTKSGNRCKSVAYFHYPEGNLCHSHERHILLGIDFIEPEI